MAAHAIPDMFAVLALTLMALIATYVANRDGGPEQHPGYVLVEVVAMVGTGLVIGAALLSQRIMPMDDDRLGWVTGAIFVAQSIGIAWVSIHTMGIAYGIPAFFGAIAPASVQTRRTAGWSIGVSVVVVLLVGIQAEATFPADAIVALALQSVLFGAVFIATTRRTAQRIHVSTVESDLRAISERQAIAHEVLMRLDHQLRNPAAIAMVHATLAQRTAQRLEARLDDDPDPEIARETQKLNTQVGEVAAQMNRLDYALVRLHEFVDQGYALPQNEPMAKLDPNEFIHEGLGPRRPPSRPPEGAMQQGPTVAADGPATSTPPTDGGDPVADEPAKVQKRRDHEAATTTRARPDLEGPRNLHKHPSVSRPTGVPLEGPSSRMSPWT